MTTPHTVRFTEPRRNWKKKFITFAKRMAQYCVLLMILLLFFLPMFTKSNAAQKTKDEAAIIVSKLFFQENATAKPETNISLNYNITLETLQKENNQNFISADIRNNDTTNNLLQKLLDTVRETIAILNNTVEMQDKNDFNLEDILGLNSNTLEKLIINDISKNDISKTTAATTTITTIGLTLSTKKLTTQMHTTTTVSDTTKITTLNYPLESTIDSQTNTTKTNLSIRTNESKNMKNNKIPEYYEDAVYFINSISNDTLLKDVSMNILNNSLDYISNGFLNESALINLKNNTWNSTNVERTTASSFSVRKQDMTNKLKPISELHLSYPKKLKTMKSPSISKDKDLAANTISESNNLSVIKLLTDADFINKVKNDINLSNGLQGNEQILVNNSEEQVMLETIQSTAILLNDSKAYKNITSLNIINMNTNNAESELASQLKIDNLLPIMNNSTKIIETNSTSIVNITDPAHFDNVIWPLKNLSHALEIKNKSRLNTTNASSSSESDEKR